MRNSAGPSVPPVFRKERPIAAMHQHAHKLTSGPLPTQILLFSIPLILSNLLQSLFNMSDIAVVGRFAGAAALGSVGSTSHLVYLFTSFLIGMGSGVNVLAARYYGAENREALEQTVHTALIVCLGTGFVILGLGELLSRPMLRLLGTKPDLIDGAALYLRIYFLGMPALALYNYGNAVFSAVGDTRRPLLFLSVSGVLNVCLNLFFVIVCRLDVAGVALASILSQYLSAALILLSLFRTREEYGLCPALLRLDRTRARSLLQLGIPSGLQNAIFSVANLFIQGGVNSFDSVTVEGNAAAANGDVMMFSVMNAFYAAGASFISQNFGAGKRDRILKSFTLSISYAAGVAVVMGGLLILLGRPFLSVFTDDPAVVEAGMQRLTIMGFSYFISAFMDGATAASRGLGKTILPVVFIILGSCVFRILWIYTVFAWFGTFRSLYLVYTFSWTITSVAEVWYFLRSYRKETALFA